jgi:DNA repair exonuclease SbcCD ATPase subunit
MSEYVSATEAADLMECSEALIRKRIKGGTLSAKKMRGRWHIRRSDIEGQTITVEYGSHYRTTETDVRTIDPDDRNSARPEDRTTAPDVRMIEPQDRTIALVEWREDLCQQVADLRARLERQDEDKVHLRDELHVAHAELRAVRDDAARNEAGLKTRVVEVEQTVGVRDSQIDGLNAQVAALEAKLREVLEQSQEQNHQLANRIADLVQQHADIHTRVLELEPVAAEVPMLQAAVEDTKAGLTEREQILFQRERQLADISEDIETIVSRPVAGPMFRLLTKGKLRI